MYADFTTTPIYGAAAFMYPPVGTLSYVYIPIHLTAYAPPVRSMTAQSIPIIPRNDLFMFGYKGNTTGYGVTQLPKITMQGWIDTPDQIFKTYDLPNLWVSHKQVNQINTIYSLTYAELMQAYFEGRAANNLLSWLKVDPLWFRDNYGRVFDLPHILDFTATYIEGKPIRTNFTMILQV